MRSALGMSSSTTTDIKYDFPPANPDPGDDYDKFRERCLNAMAKADERGWSKSDHLLGIDEGGPAGPPIEPTDGVIKRCISTYFTRTGPPQT